MKALDTNEVVSRKWCFTEVYSINYTLGLFRVGIRLSAGEFVTLRNKQISISMQRYELKRYFLKLR